MSEFKIKPQGVRSTAQDISGIAKQMKNLDWGFFFDSVDDLGKTILSPGNKIICDKAILVSKGHGPITYCIPTGKKSYTWFTTKK